MATGLTTAMVAFVILIVQLNYPFRGEISISADPFRQVLEDVGHDSGGGPPSR